MNLFISFIATYLILVMVAGAIFLFRKRLSYFWIMGLASYGLAKFVEMIVKSLYFIPRPYMEMGKDALVVIAPKDSSFPSGHATSAFLLATLVFTYNKKWGMIFYLGAILVSIGRVLALVHYPVDVMAGAILGILSTIIIFQLAKKTQLILN